RNIRGKALIHPVVLRFVTGQYMLKPGVGKLVCCNTHKAAIASVSGNKGTHGILHAAIASLYNRVLFIWIRPYMLVKKFKQLVCFRLHFFPVLNKFSIVFKLRVVFVKKVKLYAIFAY